jgi:hypothetical protein
MFLDQIKSGQSGILTYGITPPKSETAPERIAEIAMKTVARLIPLGLDALIVYDVQDESARTAEERPFPFLKALDPFEFASEYLGDLAVPKIIYRPAGRFSTAELSKWLQGLQQHNFYPVFVGVPAPDYPVKTSLPEAYELWSVAEETSVIGAVTIPERHAVLQDEDRRIVDKMNCGVSYFISQCVFNVAYARQVVIDLQQRCQQENRSMPTIIFTLTACGSAKTLHFMEWLGIHVPADLRAEFTQAENMLEKSVNVCLSIARALTEFCIVHGVPFGFNIESVAIRKDEIEASIHMVNEIAAMLQHKGLRQQQGARDLSAIFAGQG